MKKLLLLTILLGTSACAQWGEFGYRDPSQDSIWYKHLLIQYESDSTGPTLDATEQRLLYVNNSIQAPSRVMIGKAGLSAGTLSFYNSTNDYYGQIGLLTPYSSTIQFEIQGRKAVGSTLFMIADNADLNTSGGSIPFTSEEDEYGYHIHQYSPDFLWNNSTGSLGVGSAPDSTLTVDGSLRAGNALLSGTVAFAADSTIDYSGESGSVTVAIGNSSVARLNEGTGAITVAGVGGGTDGRIVILINVGSTDIDVAHQSSSASVGDRILTGTGSTVTVAANGVMRLWYDATSSKWRQI